ncbi:MAG: hypothetical protein MHM6MM_007073 [Cercozoa sp. M6MM]
MQLAWGSDDVLRAYSMSAAGSEPTLRVIGTKKTEGEELSDSENDDVLKEDVDRGAAKNRVDDPSDESEDIGKGDTANLAGREALTSASATLEPFEAVPELDLSSFNLVEWCTNAIQLSQYMANEGNFRQGLHMLRVADAVWKTARRRLALDANSSPEGQVADTYKQQLEELRADIALATGTLLLDRLKTEDDFDDLQGHEFDRLPVPESAFPHVSPDPGVLRAPASLQDAKQLFVEILRNLTIAKQYYMIDEHTRQHLEILFLVCQSYDQVARFETNAARQMALLKKKIQTLEPVLKASPDHYSHEVRNALFQSAQAKKKVGTLLRSDPMSRAECQDMMKQAAHDFSKFLSRTDHGNVLVASDVVAALIEKATCYLDSSVPHDLQESIKTLKEVTTYCESMAKKHEAPDFTKERKFASEMLELVNKRLRLLSKD